MQVKTESLSGGPPAGWRRRESPWAWVAAAVAVAVLLGSAALLVDGSRGAPGTDSRQIMLEAGLYELRSHESDRVAWERIGSAGCRGRGSYYDIVEGARVTFTDPAGKVVGSAELRAGVVAGDACQFSFGPIAMRDSADGWDLQVGAQAALGISRCRVKRAGASLPLTVNPTADSSVLSDQPGGEDC